MDAGLAAAAALVVQAARWLAQLAGGDDARQAAIVGAASLAFAFVVARFARRGAPGESFAARLGLRRARAAHVAGAMLLGPLAFVLAGDAAAGARGDTMGSAGACALLAAAAIADEILWRGAVQSALAARLSPIARVAVAAALFRASFAVATPLWSVIGLGVALSLMRERSESAVPGAALRLVAVALACLRERFHDSGSWPTDAKLSAVAVIAGAIGAACFAFGARDETETPADAAPPRTPS